MSGVVHIVIVICFGVLNCLESKCIDKGSGPRETIFVNVLFRHGFRTPTKFYRNDPYSSVTYWPEGLGQLTNIGKRQHYELGQWLRKRYDSLLTEEYNPDLVYVRSTDVDRTLMSAQCNLAGMFPPKGAQVWNEHLAWQPIPVHTIPGNKDSVLLAHASCPAYNKEYDNLMKSEEILKLDEKYASIYKILNENTGENVADLKGIQEIYDTLLIESLKNFTLPLWSNSIFPHPLEEAAKYRFALQTWNKNLARLKSGLLIQEMIKNMKDKRDEKTSRNVHIYSAHDTTMANLLNALGVFDLHSPPFGACVMMELQVDANGNHQVMLFYRNSTTEEPHILTVPGCTAVCPLDQFIGLSEDVIPEDWDKECQL